MIAAATLIGVGLNFTPIDPVKALYWSAVLNGLATVTVMIIMMHLARRKEIMDEFTFPPVLMVIGWISTAVMTLAGSRSSSVGSTNRCAGERGMAKGHWSGCVRKANWRISPCRDR